MKESIYNLICIYKIISPTNKIYIGQSWNWGKRLSNYRKLSCKGQIKLYSSLKKHGFENHKIEILLELPENITQEALNFYEVYWWRYYKDLQFNMLNIKEPSSHGKHSEESKKKMSNSQKGKKTSEYTKKRLLESNIGRIKSDEERQKISKGNKGKIRTIENKNKIKNTLLKLNLHYRPILMLDLQDNIVEEFRNPKHAGMYFTGDSKQIRNVLAGKAKTYKGYKFIWKLNKKLW